MKRRDFVYGGAVVVGSALAQGDAAAQVPLLAATRAYNLSGNSGLPSGALRDTIFDGTNFVSLFVGPGGAVSAGTVTATTPAGVTLWSYPLPAGRYWSLGAYLGDVVISAPAAMLLLGSRTGTVTSIGPGNDVPLRYAGDSTFFKHVRPQGEIWSISPALALRSGGISAKALAGVAPAIEYLQTRTIALMPRDGSSVARVDVSSGSLVDLPISSDLLGAGRTAVLSVASRYGAGVNPMTIAAIGGDQAGNILALVLGVAGNGGVALARMDASANVSHVADLQLPLNVRGGPILPMKLVGVGSEVGVVSAAGLVSWYAISPA